MTEGDGVRKRSGITLVVVCNSRTTPLKFTASVRAPGLNCGFVTKDVLVVELPAKRRL